MSEYRESFTSFFHWFAWTISCAASLIFILFFISDDLPAILSGKGKELYVFLPGLLLAISGCVFTFFRKIQGGLVMLAGGIFMVTVIYFQSPVHDFRLMLLYGLPYIFSGIVFVFVRNN